jgi:uncharacterized membrane protein
MVISHHPPSQYDRTLRLGSVRVCARCSGLFLGTVSSIAVVHFFPLQSIPSNTTILVVALPVLGLGIAAFVLNEAGIRVSNNYERLLFGLVLGSLLCVTWVSGLWPFLGLVVLVVTGQFIAALLLRRLGVLDRFVCEYLEGAIENSENSGTPDKNPDGAKVHNANLPALSPHEGGDGDDDPQEDADGQLLWKRGHSIF